MLNRSQQLFACVGVYLVASLLWFALGDALVDRLGLYDSSSAGRSRLKEYAFVLVSAAMFGVIAWRRAVLDRRSDMTVRRHLEESEARLRSLVQNSSDIISVVDEQGEVIFQTDAVSRLLGWNTADEDAGWYRVHEEDMPNLRTALAQARTQPGAEASFVYRCLHADGSWRWLESTAVNRQEDPAIGGVVIHTRDVTASRLAEERLRAETEFTNQIIDSLPGLFLRRGAEWQGGAGQPGLRDHSRLRSRWPRLQAPLRPVRGGGPGEGGRGSGPGVPARFGQYRSVVPHRRRQDRALLADRNAHRDIDRSAHRRHRARHLGADRVAPAHRGVEPRAAPPPGPHHGPARDRQRHRGQSRPLRVAGPHPAPDR